MRVPQSFAALLAWATLNACEQSALEADGGHRADGGRQADAFQPRPDGPEAPSCAEMASPPLLECFRGTVFADCGGGFKVHSIVDLKALNWTHRGVCGSLAVQLRNTRNPVFVLLRLSASTQMQAGGGTRGTVKRPWTLP